MRGLTPCRLSRIFLSCSEGVGIGVVGARGVGGDGFACLRCHSKLFWLFPIFFFFDLLTRSYLLKSLEDFFFDKASTNVPFVREFGNPDRSWSEPSTGRREADFAWPMSIGSWGAWEPDSRSHLGHSSFPHQTIYLFMAGKGFRKSIPGDACIRPH